MSVTSELANRRSVLRGMLGGTAVTVGLPFLDCFLNNSGTALANGQELPVAFGTWFWGLGLSPTRWVPKTAGANYELAPDMEPLKKFRSRLNVYSGMDTYLDGKPPQVHNSGQAVCLTGTVPVPGSVPTMPSLDQIVADYIGGRSRFRSIEVACDNGATHSHSRRAGGSINPAEIEPTQLYTRVFGPEFVDPNNADFKPDPRVMVKLSALSGVTEQRQSLVQKLGASDKARLDQYFTSLRDLERKLSLELEKPAPLEACTVPKDPGAMEVGTEIEQCMTTHKLFADILAHALACGQTRVVNVNLVTPASPLRKAGNPMNHHTWTHEEAVDPKIGYQVQVAWYIMRSMMALNDMLESLDSIREGDKTLLDRMLVFAFTDSSHAKFHAVDNLPMFTAGSANGRVKTGIHFAAPKGDPTTRLGLTVQQVMGMPITQWGTESNQTSKTITSILA
jgi:hypothetical protein